MTMKPLVALLTALLLTGASRASAADARHRCGRLCRIAAHMHGSAFDEASGRSLLNYPPHRTFDISHVRIDFTIPSMNRREIDAVATLVMAPISRPASTLTLDAGPPDSMRIVSASVEGVFPSLTTFAHAANGSLDLTFDPAVPAGQSVRLVIRYTLTDPPEGLYWVTEDDAKGGRGPAALKSAQIWSQGQPESNRFWFPCHDFPNERLTSEVFATVPRGYQVVSNGHLASRAQSAQANPGDPPMETFHWVLDREHAPYLVSLVVGRFAVVDLAAGAAGQPPMPVFVPHGWEDRVQRTFGRTPRMIQEFQTLVREPFPWAKYAQILAWDFAWGGMENTSATTLFDTCALDAPALADGDMDALIAHELAHQWFGDLLTCNSWEHLWLNEGFATYFEKIWEERRPAAVASARDGTGGGGRSAYLFGMWQDARSVIESDLTPAPAAAAMASKVYAHPDQTFTRDADPYSKGSMVLHMLRARLGDAAFWRGVALYVDRCKGRTVETSNLRRAMEDVSGLSLERFFAQWCERPGVPRVTVHFEWDQSTRRLKASAEQTQTIDGRNPAFDLDIPLWVRTSSASSGSHMLRLAFDSRTTLAEWDLPSEPQALVLDPGLEVLAEFNTLCRPEWKLAAARRCPELPGRLRSILDLASLPPDARPADAAESLRRIAANAGDFHAARSAAASALGAMAETGVLLTLARSHITDARVRRAIVQAIAHQPNDHRAASVLINSASREESPATAAAAIRAIGRLKIDDGWSVVRGALSRESWDDQVRTAAIDAIASFDRPEGIPLIREWAAPGPLSSTRAAAATALGRLAHHDPPAVLDVLTTLLADRQIRVATAAAEALASTKHPRAIEAVRTAASLTASPSLRNVFLIAAEPHEETEAGSSAH